MNGAITGWASDVSSGDRIASPDVRLYRIGVPGETCAVLDEHGSFSFSQLSPGEYSLAVYEDKYVPRYQRLTLKTGEIIGDLHVPLTLGDYISGRVFTGDKFRLPVFCCPAGRMFSLRSQFR